MMNKYCRLFFIFLFASYLLTTSIARQGNSKPKPTSVRFWTVGGADGIVERFGTNFYDVLDDLDRNKDAFDHFLLAIAEGPLMEKQIVEKSALSESRVEHFISILGDIRVIKKDEKGRWATTLPVITDNQMKVIRNDVSPMAYSIAQYMKKEMHQLETLYEQKKTPPDPSWEDVSHLLIDKFIIDGTFHSGILKLERKRAGEAPEKQNTHTTPAFFLEQGNNFSSFGTNWYPFTRGDDQREVYVLHGAVFDRYVIAMNEYRGNRDFGSVLFKITPEGDLHSLTDDEKAMLGHLEWIAEERLLAPIVHADTIKSLWPTIEKMGIDAAEVAFEHFSDILDSHGDSPYSQFLDGSDDYIQVCYHVLFGVLIEQLVESGVVSPIPEPVPEYFGVYLIVGKVF
jgi:hypothetical protein